MALEKAIIINTHTRDRIPVMFNPDEYTLNREINYAQAAVPGLAGPLLQFVHGNLQTLEMELFLDTYEAHREGSRVVNEARSDVREMVNKVTGFMEIDPKRHAPPILIFHWGSLTFSCVLARSSQKFVMFLEDGTPVRARLQVTFNEYRNSETEAKQIKRETADYSKFHTVMQGESISAIAFAEYGNALIWRPIAQVNQIDDPRQLEIGWRLLVPQLPYRDPETGDVYS